MGTQNTRKTSELLTARDEKNPRRISEGEKRKLTASIKRFGLIEPVIYNVPSNRLIGGHQRVTIAAELGIEEIPTYDVYLTPEQERLANIALNKIKGRWDAEKLEPLLRDIERVERDIEVTGFDNAELEELTSTLHSGEASQPDIESLIFKLPKAAKPTLQSALRKAKAAGPFTEYEATNQNSNGNALTRIAEHYLKTHNL